MDGKEVHPHGDEFDYMFLGRLKSDCKYFLGFGNAHPKELWAQSVDKQITLMKEFLKSFKGERVPDWITMQDIEDFETKMKQAQELREQREQIVLI